MSRILRSRCLAFAPALLWPALGMAQSTLPQGSPVPPPAPIVQTPLPPQTPPSPGFFNPGTPANSAPATVEPATAQPPPVQPPPPGPDVWLPRQIADLQALDKVSAQVQTLTLHMGQTQSFGTLSITLRACMVRPPDQPQDSAAFLEITDAHATEPGFRGWMFASEPEVSMLESPIYDIRLNFCHS